MARIIYLEFEEEALSVLQKIRKSGSDEVLLVVPKGARICSNLTGLKLLKNEAEKYQKIISVATADERGKTLLARAGIKLATLPTAAAQKATTVPHGRIHPSRMGDIMMRPVRGKPEVEKKVEKKVEIPPKAEELEALIGPQISASEIRLPELVKVPLPSLKYTLPPVVGVVVVLAALAFYVLPTAEIKITPRTEPITRDLEILVDSKSGMPDVQNLSVPGKLLTEELSDSKSYAASGVKNVGERASGFVTIYNFSKSSLILKKGTTRLEAKGKTYYFLQDAGGIRPTARIGPDLEVDVTSLIDPVPIVAAESGEDYNLPTGTRFEIFNEIFGHQPEVLYAINGNPISGGTTKQVKIVSAGDIDAARADLKNDIMQKYRQQVKDKLTPESRLLDNAFTFAVTEEGLSHQVGGETENFQFTQKAKVTALMFSEADARDLIVERIVRLLPENKFLLPQEEQRLSIQFVSLDLSGGTGTLRAHFESAVSYQINTDFLARSLPRKTATQVKEILLSRPEVSDVEVKLSPFWVKTVPRFGNKVLFKIVR